MTLDIEANLQSYRADLSPAARYASFDYCYNYFQSFRERNEVASLADARNLQVSCLQLGFYLASWGMLRGSSPLLRHSARAYVPVIEAIVQAPQAVWDIDVDAYSVPGTCEAILDVGARIRAAFPDRTSDIRVTKIMLGVFGSVPAFDTYFKKGLGVASFGQASLGKVRRFYEENADVIEAHRVKTLDFATGLPTHRSYSRAKVIDMIFFIQGGPSAGAVRSSVEDLVS